MRKGLTCQNHQNGEVHPLHHVKALTMMYYVLAFEIYMTKVFYNWMFKFMLLQHSNFLKWKCVPCYHLYRTDFQLHENCPWPLHYHKIHLITHTFTSHPKSFRNAVLCMPNIMMRLSNLSWKLVDSPSLLKKKKKFSQYFDWIAFYACNFFFYCICMWYSLILFLKRVFCQNLDKSLMFILSKNFK